jgi:hypothetical protein
MATFDPRGISQYPTSALDPRAALAPDRLAGRKTHAP